MQKRQMNIQEFIVDEMGEIDAFQFAHYLMSSMKILVKKY